VAAGTRYSTASLIKIARSVKIARNNKFLRDEIERRQNLFDQRIDQSYYYYFDRVKNETREREFKFLS
jgi:hypothetical protein